MHVLRSASAPLPRSSFAPSFLVSHTLVPVLPLCASGTSGTSGTSGASGASGASGTSGASRASGASGASGTSGSPLGATFAKHVVGFLPQRLAPLVVGFLDLHLSKARRSAGFLDLHLSKTRRSAAQRSSSALQFSWSANQRGCCVEDYCAHSDAVRCRTIAYDTVRCRTIPYDAVRCRTIAYDAVRYRTMPYDAA